MSENPFTKKAKQKTKLGSFVRHSVQYRVGQAVEVSRKCDPAYGGGTMRFRGKIKEIVKLSPGKKSIVVVDDQGVKMRHALFGSGRVRVL